MKKVVLIGNEARLVVQDELVDVTVEASEPKNPSVLDYLDSIPRGLTMEITSPRLDNAQVAMTARASRRTHRPRPPKKLFRV